MQPARSTNMSCLSTAGGSVWRGRQLLRRNSVTAYIAFLAFASVLAVSEASFVRVEWDGDRRQYFLVRPDYHNSRASLDGYETPKRLSNVRLSSGGKDGATDGSQSSGFFLSPYSEPTFGTRISLLTPGAAPASSGGGGKSEAMGNGDCSACPLRKVANGLCDTFGRKPTLTRCNCDMWDWDGGDCCEATCVSTPEHRCGEGGFACRNPKIVPNAAHISGAVPTTIRAQFDAGTRPKVVGFMPYPYKVPFAGALAQFEGAPPCTFHDNTWDPLTGEYIPCTGTGNLILLDTRIAHEAFDEVVPSVMSATRSRRRTGNGADNRNNPASDEGAHGGSSKVEDDDSTVFLEPQPPFFWVDSAVATIFSDTVIEFPRSTNNILNIGGKDTKPRLYYWSFVARTPTAGAGASLHVGVATPHTVDRLSSYQEWLITIVPSGNHRTQWTASGHFTETVGLHSRDTGQRSRRAASQHRKSANQMSFAGSSPDEGTRRFSSADTMGGSGSSENIVAGIVQHAIFSTNEIRVGGSPANENWGGQGGFEWDVSRKLRDHESDISHSNWQHSGTNHRCEKEGLCADKLRHFGILLNATHDEMILHVINLSSDEVVTMTVPTTVRKSPEPSAPDASCRSESLFADGIRAPNATGNNCAGDRERASTWQTRNFPRTLRVGNIRFRFEPASFGAPLPGEPLLAPIVLADPLHFCTPVEPQYSPIERNAPSSEPVTSEHNDDTWDWHEASRVLFDAIGSLPDREHHDTEAADSDRYNGSIVLIERGRCDFINKVMAAEARGAVGVIVMDNVVSNVLVQMKRSDANFRGTNPKIPAVFVDRMSGLEMMAQLERDVETEVVSEVDSDLAIPHVDETQRAEEAADTKAEPKPVWGVLCAGQHVRNASAPFVGLQMTGVAPVVKIAPDDQDGRVDAIVEITPPHWPPSEDVQAHLERLHLLPSARHRTATVLECRDLLAEGPNGEPVPASQERLVRTVRHCMLQR